jgi:hypothetical protein
MEHGRFLSSLAVLQVSSIGHVSGTDSDMPCDCLAFLRGRGDGMETMDPSTSFPFTASSSSGPVQLMPAWLARLAQSAKKCLSLPVYRSPWQGAPTCNMPQNSNVIRVC